jgi:hypothetical protein
MSRDKHSTVADVTTLAPAERTRGKHSFLYCCVMYWAASWQRVDQIHYNIMAKILLLMMVSSIFGAFTMKNCKNVSISSALSVCLSVCLSFCVHVITQELQSRFSWNLISISFTNFLATHSTFSWIWIAVPCTWHGDLCVFLCTSGNQWLIYWSEVYFEHKLY